MIFLSEIGDKTFIMVTVLASSVNKVSLFFMASLATAIMHTVSVMIGAFLAYLIPQTLIQIIVISLFTGFGIAMLFKAYNDDKAKEDQANDKREIEEELEKMDILRSRSEQLLDTEAASKLSLITREIGKSKPAVSKDYQTKWYQRSVYTFIVFSLMCQEWGDMSQIAAISLAAKYGIIGIIIGGIAGFMMCMLFAIIVGAVIEKFFSQKWLFLFSGCLFLTLAGMEVYKFATTPS